MNDELRFQLATNAQATIRKNWLLSQNAFRWEETFQSTINTISSNRKQNNGIVSIVKSINLQLFETFNKKEAELLSTEAKAQQAEQQIASLNQAIFERDVKISIINQVMSERDGQINAIMDSLSWKLTSPLRWIWGRLRVIRGKLRSFIDG